MQALLRTCWHTGNALAKMLANLFKIYFFKYRMIKETSEILWLVNTKETVMLQSTTIAVCIYNER